MPTTRKTWKYGWKRDLPDHRDFKLKLKLKPDDIYSSDLRGQMPAVYDQGQTSSCTGNAIAAAIEYERKIKGLSDFIPSRLFIYYNERFIENTIDDPDAGAEIRDGIKSVASDGACMEATWPFDESKVTVKPSDIAYTEAKKDLIKIYARVDQNLYDIASALTQQNPVVFGISLCESFESDEIARTGKVPYPSNHDAPIGGHAMLIVGYSKEQNHFIVRNSWSVNWGDKGYCYIPEEYVLNPYMASDFWCISAIESSI